MKQIEILLAGGSRLKSLICGSYCNLRVVEVNDTELKTFFVNLMPELTHIAIQKSVIKYLDIRFNKKIQKVTLGFDQICSSITKIDTYFD